jgi:hypothetical protein
MSPLYLILHAPFVFCIQQREQCNGMHYNDNLVLHFTNLSSDDTIARTHVGGGQRLDQASINER